VGQKTGMLCNSCKWWHRNTYRSM